MNKIAFLTFVIVACEDAKFGVFDSANETGDSAETDSETGAETGDSRDSSDSSAPDSDADVPCGGEVWQTVGVVDYPFGGIYALVATDSALTVSVPTRDGLGAADTWTLEQIDGERLEDGYDTPSSVVTGDARGDYLGVTLFRDSAMDRTCSQTYGEDQAGRFVCWPDGANGAASEVAVVDIAGEFEDSFYGYGCDASGEGVYTIEASWPNRLRYMAADGTETLIAEDACVGDTYCQSCVERDSAIVVASDYGNIQSIDIATGASLWSDSRADEWSLSVLFAWGAESVAYAVPAADDARYTLVYEPETGDVIASSRAFTSAAVSGEMFESRSSYIVQTSFIDMPDGSGGGLSIYNARTGEELANPSWAEILSVEDAASFELWNMALVDMGDGYLAFAERDGRYAGILKICG